MIVDTSALMAVVFDEADARTYYAPMRASTGSVMSAATYLESGIVVDAVRNPALSQRLDALLESLDVRVEPVTESLARTARQAYRDFGKGSGHPAQLNFGDCFSYALAVETGEPLLYKGNDFVHTGIRSVLTSP